MVLEKVYCFDSNGGQPYAGEDAGHEVGGEVIMWEDVFQVYERVGEKIVHLIASDMSIDNAVLFVKAWMEANYRDDVTSLEIRRQPRGDVNEKEEDDAE